MRERYTAVVGLERSEEVKARQDEVPAARKRNVRETSIQLPYFGRGWQNVAGKGRVNVRRRRVDLSLSMRVNERSERSRKLLNGLGGRFFIIS